MGSQHETRADQVSLAYFVADPDYPGPYEIRLYFGTVGGTEDALVLCMTDVVAGGRRQPDGLDRAHLGSAAECKRTGPPRFSLRPLRKRLRGGDSRVGFVEG